MSAASSSLSLASPSFLSQAAQLLSSSLAFEDALVRTLSAALPELGDFGFFDVVDGEAVRRRAAAHQAPEVEALLRPTQWVRQARSDLNLCALSTGEPALHAGVDDAWYRQVAAGPEHLRLLRELGFRSMITVPMRYRGELLGALTLFMGRSERQHGAAELAAAQDLAAIAAPIVVNARLVRQREQAEAALRDSEARLRLAVEAGEMGIWDWDLSRNVMTLSERVHELLQIDRERIGSDLRSLMRIVHPEDVERLREVSRGAREGRQAQFTLDFRVLRADGRVRWITTQGQALQGVDGRPERMIGVVYDITERIERLEAERQARAAADEANRAKDGFLAMLGHELRNPLAPIVTALNLIELQSPDAFTRERDIIQRQVAHLSQLVDDLLDIARITRGDLRLQRKHVALRQVLADAVEMAEPLMDARRHRLELTLPPDSLILYGDAQRLAQVFANLLNNAARYTPEGGCIVLSVPLLGPGQCRVEVQDTGQGIEPELLPHIFDLFTQGAQGLERSSGGLGVGLALVHNLVTLHRGTVAARSEGRGRGSCFEVTLPLAQQVEASVPSEASSTPAVKRRPCRVLLLDDNRDAAETLAEFLQRSGHRVWVTAEPTEALVLAGRAGADLDVAILDLGLPGMDGFEVARRLRAMPQLRRCRLIALSGYGQMQDRERSAAAGFAAHFVKPVEGDALLQELSRLPEPLADA